jgi:hypothetical protein
LSDRNLSGFQEIIGLYLSTPLRVKEMKPSKKKKTQMTLMFLTEKRDKSGKGRMVYNGKPTREWLS